MAQSQMGAVIGNVVDEDGYPLSYTHVFIEDEFGQRYQTQTDEDGRFRISTVPVGEYSLNIRMYGDTLKGIPVDVPRDGFYHCGEIVFPSPIDNICICPPIAPPLPIDLFGHSFEELEGAIIDQHVNRFNFDDLIEGTSSEIQMSITDEIVIRGAEGGHLQLIDGVKVRGELNLPSAAYQNIKVYTNGIPAKYGDTTVGVVTIETKSYFDLYYEWKAK
ncbi:MAG: carboxypeptidase-like regulatory domain-containing protein [bacterium]|nr:carboxypeptidase-like regulatory domain-containing protein [bacterium]